MVRIGAGDNGGSLSPSSPYRLVVHLYLFGRYQVVMAKPAAGYEANGVVDAS
jgi:hypothetical protein